MGGERPGPSADEAAGTLIGAQDPAWAPLGRALAAYHAGDRQAVLVVHTDLGGREEIPAALFFRAEKDMSALERRALLEARGHVLDVGAAAGAHALPLQERGLMVTALDVTSEGVDTLRDRGVRDVRLSSVGACDGRFDTLLCLMNGVGLARTLEGLAPLLVTMAARVARGGCILLDSQDPRGWGGGGLDGRYPGELHYQLEFRGRRGPVFPLLFVDRDTLASAAAAAGCACQVLAEDEEGRYLARLTPEPEA